MSLSSTQQPVLQLKQQSSDTNSNVKQPSPPPLRETLATVAAAKSAPSQPGGGSLNSASVLAASSKFSTFNINNQFKGKAVETQQKSTGKSTLNTKKKILFKRYESKILKTLKCNQDIINL